jgi:hypothetical protein
MAILISSSARPPLRKQKLEGSTSIKKTETSSDYLVDDEDSSDYLVDDEQCDHGERFS